MNRLRQSPVALALAATLLAFCWQALQTCTLYHGNWTALFRTSVYPAVPAPLAATTYTWPPGQGYDGQFYRYIAHEPWPPFRYATAMDLPALRHQRILLPALAWLLAAGRPALIDPAFLLLVDAALFLGVFASARLFQSFGSDPCWGLLFAITPAALASTDRMLTDGAQLAAFAAALVLARRNSWRALWLVCALAGLTRETGLFLPAGLALHALIERHWRRAFFLASAALPALAWMIFLRFYFPPLPLDPGWVFLFRGLIPRLFYFAAYPDLSLRLLLHVLDLLAFLGFGASVVLGAVLIVRNRRTPAALIALFFFVLALGFGGPGPLNDPLAFARPLSPLFFYIAIEAVLRRAWWMLLPPLAITLTPLAYDAKTLLAIIGLVSA